MSEIRAIVADPATTGAAHLRRLVGARDAPVDGRRPAAVAPPGRPFDAAFIPDA